MNKGNIAYFSLHMRSADAIAGVGSRPGPLNSRATALTCVVIVDCIVKFQFVTTRNSSKDEIANVNFLYYNIVHVLQNTIDSCINSPTDRRGGYVLTKFSEITQCNGHYAVQGHSRSPILVPIESSYTTSY